MKAIVEAHGGRNIAAVSANVDFIVAGDNMGPAKRQKAEKLGITILSEAEFFAMIEGAEGAESNAESVEVIAIETQAKAEASSEASSEASVAVEAEQVVQGTLF